MAAVRSLFLLPALLLLHFTGCKPRPKEYYPDPSPLIRQRLEEWQDLKFGLLMHWGPYSQWGVVESWSISPEDLSWSSGARNDSIAADYFGYVKAYENLKATFNPARFNPEKWALAAKEAGMRYVVFTTKHHDGFCMFDSRYTNYKITDTGCAFSSHPRSNVTKEIFSAFRKENFWVGAYFSKPDWHSDDYWWKRLPPSDRNANYSIQKHPEKWQRFVDFTHNQINELMTDYGKVDILWLDGSWVRKKPETEVKYELTEVYEGSVVTRNPQSQDLDIPRLVKEVRARQPQVLVVDRGVKGEAQNYLTPEQHIPEKGLAYPWETCMTMGDSWSYKQGDRYKSANDIIENLVDIVSKGGNYLLNIGPRPDGEFDSVAYRRLKEIGTWIKTNGEAIYGSRMYPVFGEGRGVRFTQSKDGRTQYVFLFDDPAEKVILNGVSLTTEHTVTLLGNAEKLRWQKESKGFGIFLPSAARSASEHVWVLKIAQP